MGRQGPYLAQVLGLIERAAIVLDTFDDFVKAGLHVVEDVANQPIHDGKLTEGKV